MLLRLASRVRHPGFRRSMSGLPSGTMPQVVLSEEVRYALSNNIPVVALESTIISHGMPYPRNLEVALQVEDMVRSNGAVPATVAIIGGVPKVGLSLEEISLLANCKASNTKVIKASRRDLAFACANKLHAATTVASTMILAHLAGVKVFATGGIGGVHRGAETTMDISADLMEFKNTPVVVVCAGVKSILDIPKTLEVLETQGVPVIGLGCKNFPAFFSSDSGVKSPMTVNSTAEIAQLMISSEALKLGGGMVVGVPNPNPAEGVEIQEAILQAVESAEKSGIKGADVTPFILSFVEKATSGKSLDSNVALIMNNSKVAAKIAVDYASLMIKSHGKEPNISNINSESKNDVLIARPSSPISNHRASVMVFGGAVIDNIGRPLEGSRLIQGSSNPGLLRSSFGGVGRNIAEKLSTSHDGAIRVSLVSAVADDIGGRSLIEDSKIKAMDISRMLVLKSGAGSATASYTAIHDEEGDLKLGIADMSIFSLLTGEYINQLMSSIKQQDLVVCDGNLSVDAFAAISRICNLNSIPLFFEPTSDHKCTLPFSAKAINKVDIIKPNFSELVVMVKKALELNLILRNKTSVQSVINSIDESQATASTVLLSSVRILACGLLNVMLSNELWKEEKPPSDLPNTSAKRTIVQGKHVLVSIGARGVVWCGSKACFGRLEQGVADAIVDDQVAYKLVPAPPIQPGGHTSGAGDAFCGSLLASLVLTHGQNSDGNKGGLIAGGGPQIGDVESGILGCYNHLLKINEK